MGFRATEHAFDAISEMREVIDSIKDVDAGLAKQLREAAQSIVLNLEEGTWRKGADRVNRYRIAAGSAAETRANLRVAVALGYVKKEAIEASTDSLDQVLAILWKIVGPGSITINGGS